MKRILGIDFGTKRLGFALGDPMLKLAVPLEVVELGDKDPVKLVWSMVEEDGYDHIVIGTPLTSDGDSTDMSLVVDEFAKSVKSITGLEVTLVNEHLTSKASDQLADESGSGRHDDSLAAMLIVQEFLNEIDDSK
ncbi:Holliday junction resolvase RuvX [Candidatus Uhrbacteria bacterium]|jgi:putative holliday junction resolvase|nr:Holliday junction resolvase RuvX [Candidatus Uhrbacteria bacterium]